MTPVEHISGETFHGRRGAIRNAFRYSVDYVMLDLESDDRGPIGFGKNRFGLWSVRDRDCGGPPHQGRGAAWAREVLDRYQLGCDGKIIFLTQPRVAGYVFNPVSFWLCHDVSGQLRVVIAEVTNTFGDRHCYICHNPDMEPITRDRWITARKVMHVSPFQPLEGEYKFRFDIGYNKIEIVIDFLRNGGGVVATLRGDRKPLKTSAMIMASVRRPFASLRVMGLIHWQAFRLWRKGAPYRTRPEPPQQHVSAQEATR